jgi:hypothetical protein
MVRRQINAFRKTSRAEGFSPVIRGGEGKKTFIAGRVEV